MKTLSGGIQNVLLSLLLFALMGFRTARAVDICFWTRSGCTGTALCCSSVGETVCCQLAASNWKASVRITNSNSCKSTRVYTGGACAVEWARSVNNFCISGARFTGGKWFQVCRRRQLLADVEHEQSTCAEDTTSCTKTVEPNAISYKEPSGKGSWVLIKENALGSYEQFMSLADSEKVAWLTAQGATYKSESQQEIVNVEN